MKFIKEINNSIKNNFKNDSGKEFASSGKTINRIEKQLNMMKRLVVVEDESFELFLNSPQTKAKTAR
jgi:CRISPR/Cas system CMR subunit Cmr4 (Cas7 group RAMP superfamily)